MSLARPLFWRKSDGHPQDGDEGKWVADGLAGRYSADKQRDGTWLLWWAHDNFVWEACATFAEVKQKAEADWQARFAAATLAAPANGEQVERADEADRVELAAFLDTYADEADGDLVNRNPCDPLLTWGILRRVAATLSTPTEDARERVMVPRIATTEMVEAGAQFTHIMDLWAAMVEAAPSTPADDCAELLREARWYVNDSLEAHEHSDGRDLLTRIDTALGNKETDRHG